MGVLCLCACVTVKKEREGEKWREITWIHCREDGLIYGAWIHDRERRGRIKNDGGSLVVDGGKHCETERGERSEFF